MLSKFSLFLLAPLTAALPTPVASYGDASATLQSNLAQKWYSDYNDTSNAIKPGDPSSFYSCSGPNMNDYPSKDEWLSFDDLWEINQPEIQKKNQGAMYNNFIKTAIQDISTNSKLDSRLILALIMQESTGGVDIECTGGEGQGHDCGLMQFRTGTGFSQADPAGSIHQMISQAVYGANGRPGFLQYFNGGSTDLSWIQPQFWGNPYAAAHMYNGGAISSEMLNVPEFGNKRTIAYANDVASRLLGWNGQAPGCKASAQCPGLNLRAEADCYA